jgi:hypothetical protein
MVEEALVEKEVYESMMRMRNNIDKALGTPSVQFDSTPSNTSGSRDYAPRKTRSGHSPEWEHVYGDGRVPEPKRSKDPVATDVMAIGDVNRDPTRKVSPYIPPTDPKGGADPFPGLREKPMG